MNNKIVILLIAIYCVAMIIIISEALFPGYIGDVITEVSGDTTVSGVKVTIPEGYRYKRFTNYSISIIPINGSDNSIHIYEWYDDKFKTNYQTVKIGNQNVEMYVIKKEKLSLVIYLLEYQGKYFQITQNVDVKWKNNDYSLNDPNLVSNQKIIAEIFNL